MFRKMKTSALAAVKAMKAHPIVFVIVGVIFAIVVAPFVFWGWNKARTKIPGGDKLPELKPMSAPSDAPPTATGV